MTPEEVLRFAKEQGAKMVDLKFVDLPGMWQHFTVPIRELEEETFVEEQARPPTKPDIFIHLLILSLLLLNSKKNKNNKIIYNY